MRRLLPFALAAIFLAPLCTHAALQAQGVPSAVRSLPRDTALVLRDSAAVARQRRDLRQCARRASFNYGIGGVVWGGAFGAIVGAVPAAVLSLFHQHEAARVALYTPAAGAAAIAGMYGSLLGPMVCGGG